jgi:uncharacterized protein YndB with AHSA1/START domain
MDTTTNPPSVVDPDALTVTRSIRIAAPLARVWAAVTEPQLISGWFGEASFDSLDAGTMGSLTWDDHGSFPVRIEAVDEPRSISYRWSSPRSDDLAEVDEEHSTVFTFTLEEVEGGTSLTVVETGFGTSDDPAAHLESHRQGWNSELDELVALVEGTVDGRVDGAVEGTA